MSQESPKSPMEEAALALYYHTAQLIKQGKSREAIITELIQKGINRETAENMLAKLDVSRANVARRNGYRNATLGAGLIILMLLPLFGIGMVAVSGLQFWAAIILVALGLFMLGRGIMQITGL